MKKRKTKQETRAIADARLVAASGGATSSGDTKSMGFGTSTMMTATAN